MSKWMSKRDAITAIERHYCEVPMKNPELLATFEKLASKMSGKNVVAYKLGIALASSFQTMTTLDMACFLNKCDKSLFTSDWQHSAACGARDFLKGTTYTSEKLFCLLAGNSAAQQLSHMLAVRGFTEFLGAFGVNPSDF